MLFTHKQSLSPTPVPVAPPDLCGQAAPPPCSRSEDSAGRSKAPHQARNPALHPAPETSSDAGFGPSILTHHQHHLL